MKYELTKEYLTGIEMIDTEHSKLFELANECYDLVMDEDAVDRFDHIVALIEELRTYAATHFAHEEEYMERIQYERRFSERYQHLRFIQKLSEINLDDIDDNQQEYLLGILDFLARWLYGHIKVMDCRIPKEEDIAARRAAQAAAAAAKQSPAETAAQTATPAAKESPAETAAQAAAPAAKESPAETAAQTAAPAAKENSAETAEQEELSFEAVPAAEEAEIPAAPAPAVQEAAAEADAPAAEDKPATEEKKPAKKAKKTKKK